MKSINKIFLAGYLATSPETRQTTTGKTVTTFSLATNEGYIDKSNQKIQQTDFHRIITWQHLAEVCEKYLKKGYGVLLEGKLKNRNYVAKDGQKRFITEVIAHDLSILTRPSEKDQA